MAKKKKFDATAFDFGANTSKPKKSKTFGARKTPSGKVYFSGGGSSGKTARATGSRNRRAPDEPFREHPPAELRQPSGT